MFTENSLTLEELEEISKYTVQKINNYPKEYGKTVDNYFNVLYPNEIRDYLTRRNINGSNENESWIA